MEQRHKKYGTYKIEPQYDRSWGLYKATADQQGWDWDWVSSHKYKFMARRAARKDWAAIQDIKAHRDNGPEYIEFMGPLGTLL